MKLAFQDLSNLRDAILQEQLHVSQQIPQLPSKMPFDLRPLMHGQFFNALLSLQPIQELGGENVFRQLFTQSTPERAYTRIRQVQKVEKSQIVKFGGHLVLKLYLWCVKRGNLCHIVL